MKTFRGSLLAISIMVVLAAVIMWQRPTLFAPTVSEGAQIFSFEKHELMRVAVERPDDDTVVLVERDGQWVIEGSGHQAGRSMVNRVKHQIHDLTARAVVVDTPDKPELFGLGNHATLVTLTLRDGREIVFRVGDPNPTSVSYYLQPAGSDVIFTVQKAAVDYYSLTLDEFRERRFSTFDSKDVVAFTAKVDLPDAQYELTMDRIGPRQWNMTSPINMSADNDHARRLLGRVSALKAVRFETRDPELFESQGLDRPRVDMEIRFSSRPPIRIRVGADAPRDSRFDALAYVLKDDDDTLYVARSGMLETFAKDPATLRNRRVVKVEADDVVAIDAVLADSPEASVHGDAGVRYAAEQWVWKDGVPVSGSTPKRVARRFAELEVEEFVENPSDEWTRYGLAEPYARVVLRNREDGQRVIRIGGAGPSAKDSEGHSRDRFYASVEGEDGVYIVHSGLVEVVRDLVRESNRKDARDAEKAARRERIGTVPADDKP